MAGLMIFGLLTSDSLAKNRPRGRFFYWGTIKLDSDPLYKERSAPCQNDVAPCVGWGDKGPPDAGLWLRPTGIEESLVWSALPAFILGEMIVHGLSALGVSQVASFFVSVPLLIFVWYYSLGWLIDRWWQRRTRYAHQLASPRSPADVS